MSGYSTREDSLATAIGRVEDLRDAVQAQTQGLYKLAEILQTVGARLEQVENRFLAVEKALAPPEGESKLESLLAALVDADRSHADALHKLTEAIRSCPG